MPPALSDYQLEHKFNGGRERQQAMHLLLPICIILPAIPMKKHPPTAIERQMTNVLCGGDWYAG